MRCRVPSLAHRVPPFLLASCLVVLSREILDSRRHDRQDRRKTGEDESQGRDAPTGFARADRCAKDCSQTMSSESRSVSSDCANAHDTFARRSSCAKDEW